MQPRTGGFCLLLIQITRYGSLPEDGSLKENTNMLGPKQQALKRIEAL